MLNKDNKFYELNEKIKVMDDSIDDKWLNEPRIKNALKNISIVIKEVVEEIKKVNSNEK